MAEPRHSEHNGGYTITEPYTMRYFHRQSPTIMRLAAHLNGASGPEGLDTFRYCELGCGNGLTTNILAAAFPNAEFVATDFNPEHIRVALHYAERSALSNVQFLTQDFRVTRANAIGQFDFISVHGVLSWINEVTQVELIDCIANLLKPDGLVFISYNCFPGWGALLPLRQMLQTSVATIEGSARQRADIGLQRLQQLADLGAGYFRANPSAAPMLDYLNSEDLSYVAHEYLSEAFTPQYVGDLLERLSQQGLVYTGTTDYSQNYDRYALPPNMRAQIARCTTRHEMEHLRAFARNERFRNDVFVKLDAHSYSPAPTLDSLKIACVIPEHRRASPPDIDGRPLHSPQDLIDSLFPLAAKGEYTLGELKAHPTLKAFEPDSILAAAVELILSKWFLPLTGEIQSSHSAMSDLGELPQLSAILLEEAVHTGQTSTLVSSQLGGGLKIDPIDSLGIWAVLKSGSDKAASILTQHLDAHPHLFDLNEMPDDWFDTLIYETESYWLPLLRQLGCMR